MTRMNCIIVSHKPVFGSALFSVGKLMGTGWRGPLADWISQFSQSGARIGSLNPIGVLVTRRKQRGIGLF